MKAICHIPSHFLTVVIGSCPYRQHREACSGLLISVATMREVTSYRNFLDRPMRNSSSSPLPKQDGGQLSQMNNSPNNGNFGLNVKTQSQVQGQLGTDTESQPISRRSVLRVFMGWY